MDKTGIFCDRQKNIIALKNIDLESFFLCQCNILLKDRLFGYFFL